MLEKWAGMKRREEQDVLFVVGIPIQPFIIPEFHHHGGLYEETEENQSFEGRLEAEKC
jgi:hypothetical protein